ncbi:Aip1p Ecym_7402 [Eremothecium cymbalariae DBVPG|uniref:Uncharacterized protein n=1 Tax=Eremothecium cymbalariae (strain CBS 270.75 / DBVPG 7215 / KCTC 17166 / NRRL Y-17582) TaxID=931890 RepID=G8JWL3_ERECY|nr:hypothetical protein Ecym_7402 [Eremothecium cymbalariae DBVPG\
MSSIYLKKTLVPLPSTTRNFTTHLSYDSETRSLAYNSGKSAIIRSLVDDTAIQFTGHGNANVTVVRFSPLKGSNYLCSGDDSGRVIVWYYKPVDSLGVVETGVVSEFKVLSDAITDISWDFEGKRLCVVGEGRNTFGAFISWDTGNSLGEVSGHAQRVNACHFKQSRPMRAITVGYDGKAVFYKGPPFQFTNSDRSHHDHGKFIRDVKFSPGTGKYCVSVGSDRKIVVYDGVDGQFIKYVEDENEVCGGFFALAWVDEGSESNKFVTASADGVVRLWDVESNKLLQKWSLGKDLAQQQVGVAVTEEKEIISLSLDGTLNVFKIGEKEIVRKLHGHNKSITTLTLNPLITSSYDGKVVKWSADDVPSVYFSHLNTVTSIENVDGEISTVSWDKTLRVNGELKFEFQDQPKESFAHNGAVSVVTSDNKLMVLNSLTGVILAETKLHTPAAAVTLGNKYAVVGYEGKNSIEVFKVSDLSDSFTLPTAMRATPSTLSLSPSEKYLAAGDTMGRILLYDLESKNVKTSRWSFHSGKITSISWRPDQDEEDHVVSTSLDTHMFIYSVKKPMKVIKKLNAHKDAVCFVCWETPNTVVTAGADACIRRWAVEFS